MFSSHSLHRLVSFALKVIFFVLLMVLMVWQIIHQSDEGVVWSEWPEIHAPFGWICILFVWLLMPLNWSLECLKWNVLLIACGARVSIQNTWKALITSLTIGFVSPQKLGDLPAKIWLLRNAGKAKVGYATWLNSLAQTWISLLFGTFGLLIYTSQWQSTPHIPWWLWIPIVFIVWISMMYWYPSRKGGMAFLFRKMRWDDDALSISFLPKAKAMSLAFVRYVVFSLQFFMLLMAFGEDPTLLIYWSGLPVFFLLQTLTPAFYWLDIGIRGNMALWVFAPAPAGAISMLLITTLLWFINILLPSLVGYGLLIKRNPSWRRTLAEIRSLSPKNTRDE